MLKLKNISPHTTTITNESDFYLKIKMSFEKRESLGTICYWSTLGPKESLMEIGFEYSTGLIYEFTVVVAHTIYYQDITIADQIIKKIGLPLFETNPWNPKVNPLGYHVEFYEQEYYLRDKDDFKIYAGEKNTTILLSSNNVILQVINDPIIFGFDRDNNLCYIHIQNMTLNEEGFLETMIDLETFGCKENLEPKDSHMNGMYNYQNKELNK